MNLDILYQDIAAFDVAWDYCLENNICIPDTTVMSLYAMWKNTRMSNTCIGCYSTSGDRLPWGGAQYSINNVRGLWSTVEWRDSRGSMMYSVMSSGVYLCR